MITLVLDTGALVAIERNDRATIARLVSAERQGIGLKTNAMVLSQVWRDGRGRQAALARFLRAVDIRTVTEQDGRAAGVLLHDSKTSDPIDATVVLMAKPGDRILTSEPDDLRHLADAAGKPVTVIPC